MADYATSYGTNIGQSTVDYGLGAAKDALAGTQTAAQSPYPAWYGSQLQGPVQSGYNVNYQSGPTLNTVQGLGANNYQDVYNSYANTAKDAYDRSLTEGDNRYGANGLYGSQGQGMQSDYMGQAQKQYQAGLLNAQTQAYNTQQTDIQQQMLQNQNQFNAANTVNTQNNTNNANQFAWDYGQQQQNADWNNSQVTNQNAYTLAQRADAQAQAQRQFENPLALATGANPNTAAQLSAQTATQNQNTAAKTAQTNALYTGLGGLAGGLLSAKTSSGGSVGGDALSALGNGASSLWNSLWS